MWSPSQQDISWLTQRLAIGDEQARELLATGDCEAISKAIKAHGPAHMQARERSNIFAKIRRARFLAPFYKEQDRPPAGTIVPPDPSVKKNGL